MKEIDYSKLSFYCNSCGEIFDPYKKGKDGFFESVSLETLPLPLQRLYYERWTDCSNSLCYVVTLDGRPGILLNSEYDEVYADDIDKDMEGLYALMQKRAQRMEVLLHAINPTIEVLLGKESGCMECHELAVFLPAVLTDEESIKAFYINNGAAYSDDFTPNYNSRDYINFPQTLCIGHAINEIPKTLSIEIPGMGLLIVKDAKNKSFPGVSVDLKRPDGTVIGLANIQKGDSERLQAIIFAELGTDNYTHCIDYVGPGETSSEDIDINWHKKVTNP